MLFKCHMSKRKCFLSGGHLKAHQEFVLIDLTKTVISTKILKLVFIDCILNISVFAIFFLSYFCSLVTHFASLISKISQKQCTNKTSTETTSPLHCDNPKLTIASQQHTRAPPSALLIRGLHGRMVTDATSPSHSQSQHRRAHDPQIWPL